MTEWMGEFRHPGKNHANWAYYVNQKTGMALHIRLITKRTGYGLFAHLPNPNLKSNDILFVGDTIQACFDYADEYIVMTKLSENLD